VKRASGYQLCALIGRDLKEAVEHRAWADQRSVSWEVREALKNHLEAGRFERGR
jgi:hypothetical protein